MTNETLKVNFLASAINFAKKKIKLLILLLVFILIFLFSYLLYENFKNSANIQIAEKYTRASILIKQKKIEEGKSILKAIINENHKFYSPLALYLIIDKNIESDEAKIIIFFDKILKNKSIDRENLNLIKIKKAIYLIDLDKEDLMLETLNPIINSNSAWRDISINLITEYFLSKNQKVKADEYIQLLNKNNNK